MILKNELAARIKQLCTDKGLSISELERQAGYSSGMISRWAATEEVEFTILTKLVSIADLLDIPFDALLDRSSFSADTGTANHTLTAPVSSLLKATETNTARWQKLEPETQLQLKLGQIPLSESGRSLSSAWLMSQEGVHFLLASYCDDIDDILEPIELVLYYVVGHGMPVYRISADKTVLQTLYAQLSIQQACLSLSGSASACSLNIVASRTLPEPKVVFAFQDNMPRFDQLQNG